MLSKHYEQLTRTSLPLNLYDVLIYHHNDILMLAYITASLTLTVAFAFAVVVVLLLAA